MRYAALIITALLVLVGITSTQSYFDALDLRANRSVFAFQDSSSEPEVMAKPIARSNSEARKAVDMNLKLMTYNIHRGIGKSGKLDLNATSGVIDAVQPDVVALQEVERYSIRTGFKDQIKHLASKLGMSYAYGKSIHVLNGEYGNGLLSRYPIEEYGTHDLPSMGEQRTVLRTVVNIEGYRLAVYSTHLGLKQAERVEQLDYIMQLIETEEIDVILMGDMNTRVDKLTRITEVLKDSAEGSINKEHNTFEDEDMQERIDYIFLPEKMKPTGYDVVESQASDHYPVVCEVEIQK